MRVLVIDDDRVLTRLIEQALRAKGLAVDTVYDGKKGLELAKVESSSYSVVIIDVLLPNIDGLTICERLRKNDINVPILLLSSRDHVDDKVKGLDIGADDYLGKPFDLSELTARVQALARRSGYSRNLEIKIKNLFISADKRVVKVDEKDIHLTPTEFRILFLLIEKFESVISRSEILDKAWDTSGENVFSNSVDVHVKNIRNKLEKASSEVQIETVREVGYKAI